MTKVKKNESISKDTFEHNANLRRDNINNIKAAIAEHEAVLMGIEYKIMETRVRVNMGPNAHKPFEPTFPYEIEPEYLEAQHLRQKYILENLEDQKNHAMKEMEASKVSLKNEELRLKLIEQGIPAWRDNEFRNHSEE